MKRHADFHHHNKDNTDVDLSSHTLTTDEHQPPLLFCGHYVIACHAKLESNENVELLY